jgi:Spy/CpxP family protein refolding chaperone
MKTKLGVLLIALLSTMMLAQDQPPQGPPSGGPGGPPPMGMHGPHPFQWWKNSDTVSKLNLSTTQVTELDQTFNQHKTNLKTDMEAMRTADKNLRTLLDQDNPDQTQVTNAANQVLAARGNVERETTMMMLDFRKVLTADQWKQLRAMHPMGPGFGGHMRGKGWKGGQNQAPPPPDGSEPAPPPPQD